MIGTYRFVALALAMALRVSHANCQDFVSLTEVAWANSDAVKNYDVSYKIEFSRQRPSPTSSNESNTSPAMDEMDMEIQARLVMSNAPKRVLFLSETKRTRKGLPKADRTFECCYWENGRARFISTQFDGVADGKQNLFEFYRNHFILEVERCTGNILALGMEKDIEAEREQFRHRFAETKAIVSATGAIRVSANTNVLKYRTVKTFDPVSLMPTMCSVDEIDPLTNARLKNVWWDSPRFELNKNVYRLVGCTFSGDSASGQTNGSAAFFWHQFNEDSVLFPEKVLEDFTMKTAEAFLRQGVEELSQ